MISLHTDEDARRGSFRAGSPRDFLAQRPPGRRLKLRISCRAAANGHGGRPRTGAGRPSGRRGRHGRGQIAGLSHSRRPPCGGDQAQGRHLDPHHRPAGAAHLQGYPLGPEAVAHRIRGGAPQRAAQLRVRTRLDRAMSQSGDLFSPGAAQGLERIHEWSLTTKDGR